MYNKLKMRLARAVADESGQGLAEYGLILALIALVAVGALATLGSEISNLVGWRLFDAVSGGGGGGA